MKFVMDEKLKHRIVGIAVIISLGAVFAPAIIRQSSQKLEGNFSVNVTMPKKPAAPDVGALDEKEVFKTIKVTRVALPNVPSEKQLPQLVHAESLSAPATTTAQSDPLLKQRMQQVMDQSVTVSAKREAQAVVTAQKTSPKKVLAGTQKSTPAVHIARDAKKAVLVAKNPAVKKTMYVVQLASFSQLKNAQALVDRLHSKGYKASYSQVTGKQGMIYKVYAGHSPHRNDVEKLKTQLANTLNLKGFVVNAGVS